MRNFDDGGARTHWTCYSCDAAVFLLLFSLFWRVGDLPLTAKKICSTFCCNFIMHSSPLCPITERL